MKKNKINQSSGEYIKEVVSKLKDKSMYNWYIGEVIVAGTWTPEQQKEINLINSRLDKVEQRLDKVEQRLDKVEQRLDKVEQRLDKVEQRLDKVEQRLAAIENQLLGIQDLLKQLVAKK